MKQKNTPKNLWNLDEASRLPDLDGLVCRSDILRCDRTVVNIYGSNTSAKRMMTAHVGRQVQVLAVKASGSNIFDMKEKGFSLLKMDEVIPTFQRETMTDEERVGYLNRTVFEQGRPHQSIETLLHGSGIWDSQWKEARAKQYGVSADKLNDFYKQRNTLKVEILPEDIAEAIVFLGGGRASKTTGVVLTVDGGVPAAYVR